MLFVIIIIIPFTPTFYEYSRRRWVEVRCILGIHAGTLRTDGRASRTFAAWECGYRAGRINTRRLTLRRQSHPYIQVVVVGRCCYVGIARVDWSDLFAIFIIIILLLLLLLYSKKSSALVVAPI